MEPIKIGVVSCSGEDCLGGTISRLATRNILERIRLGESSVTICLPLFIAGGEEERDFAKDYPTITVDGCNKYCARRATEKLSGKVTDTIQVGEIIGEEKATGPALSTRKLTPEHHQMADKVAEEISIKFDRIVEGNFKK
ncbi:putative zinc-binding protein [Dehalobacterium formicoaceticum]|uniref:Zinc-binding protein n=1 Tax=Dehalobacterium formicoaceticum TaxID=51515 RepID=A0ABT1Y1G5_9FIRM|nr:putative zinc-binding protein [Dehalobacterium formicoaceticum]MCR6544680.1 putative zinc-binding protein [Dehalobacterium formicoaceticum]